MNHRLLVLLAAVLISKNTFAQANPDMEEKKKPIGAIALQKKDGLECRYLSMIEDGFLKYHVNYNKRDKELETRVTDQHIKKLDPSKIYFFFLLIFCS